MRIVVGITWLALLCSLCGCEPKSESTVTGQSSAVTDGSKDDGPAAAVDPIVVKDADRSDRKTPLDPRSWPTADVHQRNAIAQKLVASNELLGLTEDEVVALLGPPDRRTETIVYLFYVNNRSEPGGSIPAFVINFDRQERVTLAGRASFPHDPMVNEFDAKVWREGSDQDRFAMAPVMERRRFLIGKTREVVLKLLGEPSEVTPPILMYNNRSLQVKGDAGKAKLRRLRIVLSHAKVSKVSFP